jgi:uncharacterized delta-60 repeat protein
VPEERTVKHTAVILFSVVVAAFLTCIACPQAAAQISVTSANPNSAAQGTVNLNVTVNGNGFKKGAKAQWFVTGTTNPGGVTVNSTAFNNSNQLTANITVAVDAATGNFDIQVTNTDGRTGKGTELFAVQSKGNGGTSCPATTPLNSPISASACSTFTGQTCLDATFGNASQVPPGGLVLTNTDGSVPGTADIDGAAAIKQQKQPDGTLRYVAIGSTSEPNPNGSGYIQGAAIVRYNSDGSLDTPFGSGGMVKYFTPSGASSPDGAIDANGNILVVLGQNSSSQFLLRLTPSGILDTSFNSAGYQSLSGFAASAVQLQADGKIVVGGYLWGSKHGIGALIVRLNTDGTFDTTFGTNGQTVISSVGVLNALAFQIVGGQQYVLIGGSSTVGTAEAFTVARLTPAGLVDSTFGTSGLATTTFCGSRSRIYSLSVDPLGNILAGGWNDQSHFLYALARFENNGALDTTFGDPTTPGQTLLNFYGSDNQLTSIQPVLDSSGNETGFAVTGFVRQSTGQYTSNSYWGIAQYHTNGSLDMTFGTNGAVAIDFGSQDTTVLLPCPSNLLIQADGKIVAVGTSKFSTGPYAGYNFALARLWP